MDKKRGQAAKTEQNRTEKQGGTCWDAQKKTFRSKEWQVACMENKDMIVTKI